MFGTTTTVNPNVFQKTVDLEAPVENHGLVDLEEAQNPGPTMDLDGKLEEENFGQSINENVTIDDVADPLTKPSKSKKDEK